ncbi:phage tail tape measure protein [Bacillus licheniformis]|uniref:phage tail tape measure protein n=1 Tax=Bacillus TaxID=1386 RepID=UPI000BA536A8|nr:phage tail tape measure protein [Bacillus licheniformis]MBY8831912.1 phage tail tape measure protein [Bacillus licheniformis]MDE1429584.1 phage tail tape measure protein [Bacillus licheniformis]MDO0597706.1 phage tail tape measure protein [Bacillus licheniformis]MED1081883.1 phage tail tape measure protein [Bacillus licheniformis]PAD52247.1 phage tail tape measure protein [Bacillus licheniformis]
MAGATVGEIRARLILDMADWSKKSDQAKSDMSEMGKSSKKLSKEMGQIQKASLAVGGAVVAGIGASVKTAADFEAAMSNVKAISGATGQEFEDLKNIASKMGAETKFTAVEAAEGLQFLAMAGFSVKEQVGSLPAVLNLASASNESLGRSADIVSNIMTGFGIKAEESGHAVDVLVKAMTTANTDLGQLGDAMKYVAPVANGLGYSIEDTAAAVAKMSDAGIQGSMAGTALRATLLHLSNPVGQTAKAVKKYNLELEDANGNLKSLPELIGYISKNLEGMSDAQKTATAAQLVGTEAASGFVTLLGVGEKGLRDYSNALKNAGGTADRVAKTQMDNLKGSFEKFKSALDGLGIKIGNEFLPTFRKIVDEGTKILDFLNKLNPGIITTGLEMAGTAAAIALVASTVVKLGVALKSLTLGPVGLTITALSLLGGLLIGVKNSYDAMNTVSLEAAETKQKEIESLDKVASEFDKLQSKTKLTADEFAHYLDLNDRLKTETDPEVIKRLKDEQANLKERSGLTNAEFDRFLKLNDDIVKKAPETNAAISEQGNAFAKNTEAVKKLSAAKAEELRTELEKQKATAQSKEAEHLQKQQNLKTDIKKLDGERAELEGKIADQTQKVKDITAEVNAAKEEGRKKDQYQAEINLAAEEATLNKLREQLVANLDNLQTKRESLGEVEKELGKLKDINQKLIDIELKQVGLNAKKGEGVNVLRKELLRLEDVKAKLENNTSAADKKTKEYRDSVKAVDKEIAQLKSALSRVQAITKEAETMNEKLARRINKKIHVTYSADGSEIEESASTFKKTHGKGGKEVPYHVGGIVGRGQINKLHTGGLASKFENAPMSHEVDIRALRNEMVLTEAQQANLMRMIDAGHTAAVGSQVGASPEVLAALTSIERAIRNSDGKVIVMNDEVVGRLVEPYVSRQQAEEIGVLSAFNN